MALNCSTVIESLGIYLPEKIVASREILAACRNRILYPLERLTGIKVRRMAGDTEFSIDLAIKSIESAFERSKYGPTDIDLVICCNISRYDGPNFHFSFEPSTSIRLQHHFGFRRALVFDISNACAGMFTGVNIVDGFIKAGLIERGLVVSGEYITHLTRTAQAEIEDSVDARVACLTLGDSGAAVILERSADREIGFQDIDMYTLGRYSDLCIARPTASEAGGAIMFTESLKLHAIAIRESVLNTLRILKQQKWSFQVLQHFIMHQTARVAIAETAKQINEFFKKEVLARHKMINNLAERGNTSTTTHFVALWDNILNNRIHSQDKVVFAIQASGITVGTAPYQLDDLPDRLRNTRPRPATRPAAAAKGPDMAMLPGRIVPEDRRIRIESLGLIEPGERRPDAIEMASLAGERCLKASRYQRQDIDLLIHAGVHRNDFICEPALAAIIAGRLGCNDDERNGGGAKKTFAFDIFNGAVGFLNACCTGSAMVRSGKFETVLVATSEIENNTETHPNALLGIEETGSALILDTSTDDTGFGTFLFDYRTDHIDAFSSYIGQDSGTNYLSFTRDPRLTEYYLDCIPRVVRELLDREGLKLTDIAAVLPPQISSDFIRKLAARLNLGLDQMSDVVGDGGDLFTSSFAYAFGELQRSGRMQSGDIALIINVGTGVQVGCATYYF